MCNVCPESEKEKQLHTQFVLDQVAPIEHLPASQLRKGAILIRMLMPELEPVAALLTLLAIEHPAQFAESPAAARHSRNGFLAELLRRGGLG